MYQELFFLKGNTNLRLTEKNLQLQMICSTYLTLNMFLYLFSDEKMLTLIVVVIALTAGKFRNKNNKSQSKKYGGSANALNAKSSSGEIPCNIALKSLGSSSFGLNRECLQWNMKTGSSMHSTSLACKVRKLYV